MKKPDLNSMHIRTKIMLWYILLTVLILCIVFPSVYFYVRKSLVQSLEAKLQYAVSQTETAADAAGGTIAIDRAELQVEKDVELLIKDAFGKIIYQTSDASWMDGTASADGYLSVARSGETWSVLHQTYEINETRMTVCAGCSSSYLEDALKQLLRFFLLLVPAYFLISMIGSYFIARLAMKPVRRITQTAAVIGKGDLSERITGVTSKDEVGQLADTFNSMLDELQVSFARERQFTSDASHELRMPVAVISACAQDSVGSSDVGELQENMKTIQDESNRMSGIISQLLMLSRGYEGRTHFEPEEIMLSVMVDSVAEELANTAQLRSIQIHNDVPEEVRIYTDQSLMTQLFVNVIGNAVKYGKDGGNIWIKAVCTGTTVKIVVQDDGIGISKEDQPHVFERFYRADKARDRSGSGLGLAIVKWITDMHGGTIQVQSEEGQGSSFIIELLQKQIIKTK